MLVLKINRKDMIEMEPQWNRINSAFPKNNRIKGPRRTKIPINFKIRSNSSNALNNREEELSDQEISSFNGSRKNYHSAQRSEKNSRQGKYPIVNESVSILKAIKFTGNEK